MAIIDSTFFFEKRWDLWRQAKQFPDLYQACDYTLTFTLGRDNFGFEYGRMSRKYTGPKLNLTGATVKLVCQKMPYKPSLLDEARGEPWATTQEVFEVEGTVTDAAGGEVEFELDDSDTDVTGQVLAQIQVTDSSDKTIIPGLVRITFLEKLG